MTGRQEQQEQTIPLAGGLDLVSPASQVRPGFMIGALNYEAEARGYIRSKGYERFDGRPKPSEASYAILPYASGNLALAAGVAITGLTSGATATLLEQTLDSGSFGSSNAKGDLVVYNPLGTFLDGEALQTGGVTRALMDGTMVEEGAESGANHSRYLGDVADIRRSAILAAPGSGPIRGLATLKGSVYCFRDNAGGTAGQLLKATASGWAAQSFGHTLDFVQGTAPLVEGAVITGATSGATATIQRVAVALGGFGTGDASGYLVLSGVTGTFNASEIISGGGGSARTSGSQAAITLPAAGTYEAIAANFYATETGERLYFTTRTGRAFEWDGTVLAPIRTGMPTASDKPWHIAFHRNHLFLSFPGGSLQNSATGEPLIWSAISGAGEIGFGQDITALKSENRDALIVLGRNKVGYLTGASVNDFDLASITEDSGGIRGTLEVVGSPVYLDDLGLRDLRSTASFGDWEIGSITRLVEPLIRTKRDANIAPAGCLRVRAKAQYRLYYQDGDALSVYLGRKDPEITPLSLGFTPTCFLSGETLSGSEILLAGSSDGFVYQLDVGTSRDGQPLEAYIRLAYLNQGSASIQKRYHRARLEGKSGETDTILWVSADFSYGSEDVPEAAPPEQTMFGQGGFWDTSNWDQFVWDAEVATELTFDLYGLGTSVSLTLSSEAADEDPHILSAITLFYTRRRRKT